MVTLVFHIIQLTNSLLQFAIVKPLGGNICAILETMRILIFSFDDLARRIFSFYLA